MTIKIELEYDFEDLLKNSGSGAIDTLKTIEEHGKEKELMILLNDMYLGKTPTDGEIDDLLRFEDDWVFEQLGIPNEEE